MQGPVDLGKDMAFALDEVGAMEGSELGKKGM